MSSKDQLRADIEEVMGKHADWLTAEAFHEVVLVAAANHFQNTLSGPQQTRILIEALNRRPRATRRTLKEPL